MTDCDTSRCSEESSSGALAHPDAPHVMKAPSKHRVATGFLSDFMTIVSRSSGARVNLPLVSLEPALPRTFEKKS
jgi:hypothetical protein